MLRRLKEESDYFVNRNLEDYNTGFGNPHDDMYWLGLDRISNFTQKGDSVLRIEVMTHDGGDWFGEYDGFKLTKNMTTKEYTAEYTSYSSDCECCSLYMIANFHFSLLFT